MRFISKSQWDSIPFIERGSNLSLDWAVLSPGYDTSTTMYYTLRNAAESIAFARLADNRPAGCGGSATTEYIHNYSRVDSKVENNISAAANGVSGVGSNISASGNNSAMQAVYSSAGNIAVAITPTVVVKQAAAISALNGTWSSTMSHGLDYRSIVFNGTNFILAGRVAADASGYIATSPDGSTWTRRVNLASTIFRSVTAGGSQVVAVTAGHGIYISNDNGVNWTQISFPSGHTNTEGICYANGQFVWIYSVNGLRYMRRCTAFSTSGSGVDTTVYATYRIPGSGAWGELTNRIVYNNGLYSANGR